MQQGGAIFRQLVAGKEWDLIRGDIRDPLKQQVGFALCTLADDKRHDQAPLWGKGNPHPRITSCTMVLPRPQYAGAKYTTSFSDNFKCRISTQLFETKDSPGPFPISVIISTAEALC